MDRFYATEKVSIRAIDENYGECDGCSGNGAYRVPTCENGVGGIDGVSTTMSKTRNPLQNVLARITEFT